MSQVRCYSLRRINPFRGVAAVVRTEGGRAFTVDGLHWQLQVLAHAPRGIWAASEDEGRLQYFRFGIWDATEGLTRVPLNPLLDMGRMVAAAGELTRLLPELGRELPFPLAPEAELWLLDPQGAPLALLATALEGTDPAALTVEQWQAGARGERPFISPSLSARGIPDQDAGGRYRHAEAVEQLIRRTAGTSRNRRWFGSDQTGSVSAAPSAPPPVEAAAGAPAFPELLVRERWPDEASQGLMDDYLAWLSPYLLTLPTLSDATRRRLERQACRYAELVEATWRLYPKVLDPALLRQARVEARLRQAAAA